MKAMRGLCKGVVVLAAVGWLAGCGVSINRAPVEDRGSASGQGVAVPEVSVATEVPLPGAENAGKPGYYTVRPGDTLIRIGLETGQGWKDLARWNNLENPDRIEVGQVVRVVPPVAVVAESGVVMRPVSQPTVVATPADPQAALKAGASAPAPAAPAAVAPAGPAADAVSFIWPATGSVLAGFDESRNKGLDIGGKAGDPVQAAADGRVVYSGAGLRGYGNLIILKHNNTYLTAYAHNQKLLVKEDQNVRRGQRIAEMGSTDADRVKLHFEIRRQGKPVDPVRYLPGR